MRKGLTKQVGGGCGDSQVRAVRRIPGMLLSFVERRKDAAAGAACRRGAVCQGATGCDPCEFPGTMAAPTIYFHGSEELKRRLLPKLFSCEEIWCQGFSEPGAGSDLASVQTFAERKGDKWIINGHKVWTSTAQFATWMILLARTDRSDKYNGLTYFVVPIKSELGKSVTVRPLIKITGETGFNEEIFEGNHFDRAPAGLRSVAQPRALQRAHRELAVGCSTFPEARAFSSALWPHDVECRMLLSMCSSMLSSMLKPMVKSMRSSILSSQLHAQFDEKLESQ